MSIPTDRNQLRERWANGERFEFLFFYGHQPPERGVNDSCFSQWFVRDFSIDGIEYATAEHWMMAEKARLFQDEFILEAILDSETPKEAKALGRKVRGFDPIVWDENKFDIVVRGNYEKFTQHEDLKNYLLATSVYVSSKETLHSEEHSAESGEEHSAEVREQPMAYRVKKILDSKVILVEAAGRDVIWGIGLGMNNPKAHDPATWRGRNLLGFALTVVREKIASEELAKKRKT